MLVVGCELMSSLLVWGRVFGHSDLSLDGIAILLGCSGLDGAQAIGVQYHLIRTAAPSKVPKCLCHGLLRSH